MRFGNFPVEEILIEEALDIANELFVSLSIDDAVRATVLAGESPQAAGKIYDVASGEHVTQREFIDATTDALDLPRCRRQIGRRLALLGAWLIERMSKHEAHISRAMVALMSTDQVVDAGRIRAELGWRPEVSFAEGMRRMRQPEGALPASPSGRRSLPLRKRRRDSQGFE